MEKFDLWLVWKYIFDGYPWVPDGDMSVHLVQFEKLAKFVFSWIKTWLRLLILHQVIL